MILSRSFLKVVKIFQILQQLKRMFYFFPLLAPCTLTLRTTCSWSSLSSLSYNVRKCCCRHQQLHLVNFYHQLAGSKRFEHLLKKMLSLLNFPFFSQTILFLHFMWSLNIIDSELGKNVLRYVFCVEKIKSMLFEMEIS